MNTYIAFLRAINVGGYRKIKMKDLREMLEKMGLKNVRTYIQSGNVVFDSDESDPKILETSIEQQILSDFGHDVPVMIRTDKQLQELIDKNPFEAKEVDPFKLYVTFFLETPPQKKQEELISLTSDIEKFTFLNGDLFALIDKKTIKKVNFSNAYIERIIGIPGTNRNWKTVNKMVEMASKP